MTKTFCDRYNNEIKTIKCDAYHNERNYYGGYGVCWGTKEKDPCTCGGDWNKCNFYRHEDENCEANIKKERPMYDELKERCRTCSQGCIYPSDCSYFNKPPLRCMRQLLSEAANAIEEMSKYVNYIERLKCEGWYLQQTKYHDGYQAIATMPLPKPPKEETV